MNHPMNNSTQQCVEWPHYSTHMHSKLSESLLLEKWCDVTLACDDGRTLRAHRVLLCAGSQYFERILPPASVASDIYVVIKDCPFDDVAHLVRFLYSGAVNVTEV